MRNPDAIARDAGLCYLEDGAAHLVAVADADLVVAQSLHSEVLTELAVHEVISSKLTLPVAVRAHLVDEHRPLLAAVPRRIALTIAVNVEPADPAGPATGSLKTPVKTVLPCQDTSFGKPTLTDNNVPASWTSGWLGSTRLGCGWRAIVEAAAGSAISSPCCCLRELAQGGPTLDGSPDLISPASTLSVATKISEKVGKGWMVSRRT